MAEMNECPDSADRDACKRIADAERIITDMDDRLQKVETGVVQVDEKVDRLEISVAQFSGRLAIMQGSVETMLHMSEETTRAQHDLASRLDQFIGRVEASLKFGEAKMQGLEEKAEDVAPVGMLVKGGRAIVATHIGKGISLGVAGAIVLIAAAMLGYSVKDVFGAVAELIK